MVPAKEKKKGTYLPMKMKKLSAFMVHREISAVVFLNVLYYMYV